MIIVNENINIGTYSQLIAFLKVKAKGYVPKKAKVLEGHQVLEFMKNAPNSSFLMHKVVLVMGINICVSMFVFWKSLVCMATN